jgi:hypothetical protein
MSRGSFAARFGAVASATPRHRERLGIIIVEADDVLVDPAAWAAVGAL